jgi:uncharacterized membrane protein YgcG
MDCPHCSTPLAPAQNRCVDCGFDAAALAAYLGTEWVRLRRINDAAHCLRLEESRKLEVLLDDLERQFPQVFAAVYFGALPPRVNPLEMGMWLLNHGAFATHLFAKRNEFGLVYVVDPAAGSHGLVIGYGLEAVLPARQTARLLGSLAPSLKAGRWARAVELLVGGFSSKLRKHANRSRRNVESAPPPRTGSAGDYGFEPLRKGHRHSGGKSAPAPK